MYQLKNTAGMRSRKPHHLGSFDMIFLTVKMLSSLHSQWFECKPWSLFLLLWQNLPFTDMKKKLTKKGIFAIWTFLYFKILTVKMLSLHWMMWVHLKKHALILRKWIFWACFAFSQNKKLQRSKCLAYFWAGAVFIAGDVWQ